MHHLIGARWLRAALLALAALMTGCASVQTTDRGEIGLDRKQYFVDGSREAMVKQAALHYDRFLTLALKHHALNADPAIVERVTTITNRLIPHVRHFRPEAADWAWEVNVISLKGPNATCMAGGKIQVYTGLIEQWQPNDDELAAVIGHEIGHALRDHTAEKYSVRQRNSGIATGLGAVLSVGLALTTGVNLGDSVGGVAQLGAEALGNLPNSRELEHESDRIGMELMARAGYDPRGAATLWAKVMEKSRAAGETRNGTSFWRTHPSTQDRVDELIATEPKVRPLFLAAAAEQTRLAQQQAEQQQTEQQQAEAARAAAATTMPTPTPAPAVRGEALNGTARKPTPAKGGKTRKNSGG